MKHLFTYFLGVFLLLLVTLVLTPNKILAATSLYLSPASSTVVSGGSFAVALRVNSGADAVNAVQTNLTYNSAKLDIVSIDYTGSAFSIQAQQTLAVGSIQLARGTTSPVTGDKLIAIVNFKAKAGATGVANVQYAAGSEVISSTSNTNILTGTSGGTYTIGSAAIPTPTPIPTETVAPTPTPIIAPSVTPTAMVVPTPQGLTLGKTTVGSQTDIDQPNIIHGSKVRTGALPVQVTSMSVNIGTADTGHHNMFEVAIYTDQNNEPDDLVAKSATGTLTGNSWNTLPINAVLQANTSYWLVYNNNGSDPLLNNMRFDDSSDKSIWKRAKFGDWPESFNGVTGSGSGTYSIYANLSGVTPTINPSLPSAGQGSTIVIYAAGTPGKKQYPNMRLRINNVPVKTFKGVKGEIQNRKFDTFTYTHPTKVTPNMVRISFLNDYWNRRTGDDRNLVIDKVVIDGIEYQTEGPTIYSKGTWSSDNGCGGGFKKSEWLHCKGYFQF